MATRDAYLSQLQSLLPPGPAWTRDRDANLTKMLDIVAGQLTRADESAQQLLIESDPRRTVQLILDWEAEFGLPDECTGDVETLQERRLALIQKITNSGGQSKTYFASIAVMLGYNIEITEYRPFICGISRCGDILKGGASVRHYWRVKVLQPRVTYFRSGVSRTGEKLVTITRAADLECLLNRLKPAHTNLIFAYEGV